MTDNTEKTITGLEKPCTEHADFIPEGEPCDGDLPCYTRLVDVCEGNLDKAAAVYERLRADQRERERQKADEILHRADLASDPAERFRCEYHKDVRPDPGCIQCGIWLRYRNDEASRQYQALTAGDQPMPEPIGLRAFLDEPDEDEPMLIEDVWPREGHVLLSAREKLGKTTIWQNAVRALVDGDRFLTRWAVPETVNRVFVFDLEMPRRLLKRQLRKIGVQNLDRVHVTPMRGLAARLDVRVPEIRAYWVSELAGADVVILDCLGPVLIALGLDPDRQGRDFLEAWVSMLTEAGVPSSLIIHHHGYGAERSKGDSGIRQWADVFWDLVSENPDDPAEPRFFRVFGRDSISVPEGMLIFKAETERLVYTDVSRADHRANKRAQQRDQEDKARAAKPADEITRLLRVLKADTERSWTTAEVERLGVSEAKLSKTAATAARRAATAEGLLEKIRVTAATVPDQYFLTAAGQERAGD